MATTSADKADAPVKLKTKPKTKLVETLTARFFHPAPQLVAPEALPQIEGYEFIEVVGKGGMGVVYKVRNLHLDKTMAIKILHSELAADEQNVRRFALEANAASLLAHPNLVSVYQSGTTSDGKPYLVMDFVDGRTLDEVIRTEGYLEIDRFIDIFKQVCEALVHAHGKGIIHRDLKPSNIMLIERQGEPEMVKLVDFGIARVMQEATRDGPKVTQTGDVIGSPTYMSPEQCLGTELEERSDIYSLGVVMYEALTGKPPFDGDNIIQTILHQVQSNAVPISKARPDLELPDGLEHLIMTALEKSPANRQAAVDQILHGLDKVSDELIVQPRKPKRWKRKWAKLRHNMKSNLSQIVIAASCLLVLGGTYTVLSDRTAVDWQTLVQKAEIAHDRQDFTGAAELYEKALSQAQANRATPAELAVLNENLDFVYYDMATDFRSKGTPDKQKQVADGKGAECAERAIALYDKYPEQLGQPPVKLLNRASFFQSRTGHTDAAEKLTRRAIAQFKENPEKTPIKEYITSVQELAYNLEKTDPAQADQLYKQTLELHKQASDWNDWEGENYLLVTMARFYADQKRWHEAEILLKRAIAEDRHPNPYFRQLSSYYGDPLARALEEQGKHAEAEQIRQQMHANPWSQPAHKRS